MSEYEAIRRSIEDEVRGSIGYVPSEASTPIDRIARRWADEREAATQRAVEASTSGAPALGTLAERVTTEVARLLAAGEVERDDADDFLQNVGLPTLPQVRTFRVYGYIDVQADAQSEAIAQVEGMVGGLSVTYAPGGVVLQDAVEQVV